MIKKVTIYLYLLTIFSLPFVTVYNFSFFRQKILLTEICFLLTGVCFAVGIFTKSIKIKFDRFYVPLVLYLAVCFVATIFSTEFSRSLVKFVGVAYLVGLAVLSFNLIDDMKISRQVCFSWLAGSFVTALISAITVLLFYFDRTNSFLDYSLAHYGTLPPANYPRVQSTFFIVNMLCHYLSISWMILLVCYQLRWIGRAVFYILLFLLGIAAVATFSPSVGGILLGTGLWLWVYFKFVGKKNLASGSLFTGIAGAVFFFLIITFMVNFFGRYEITPSVRLQAWIAAVKTFLQYPLFGKGLGTNSVEVYVTTFQSNQVLLDAHQMWLNLAAQAGILGFLVISFLGIAIIKRGLPLNFQSKKAILTTGLSIAFISAFFYQGLAGSYEDARHLWILIGFLGAVTNAKFDQSA